MNRNSNEHFAVNPTNLDIKRSTFNRDSSVLFTGNIGDIIPFYVDPIYPGDTCKINTSKVVRLQTLMTPIMDNIYLDTYYFFVPSRLVWQHWKEFMGENTESAWIPQTEYVEPQLTAPSGGWSAGTIADYMGIPTGVDNIKVSALPFRAYSLIMNDWFRSEALMDPAVVPLDDSDVTGSNGANYITDMAKGGMPFKAAKFFDQFTGALPSPQRGPDVTVPLTDVGDLPVLPKQEYSHSSMFNTNYSFVYRSGQTPIVNPDTPRLIAAGPADHNHAEQVSYYFDGGYTSDASMPLIRNLWAVMPENGLATSINSLRLAFQLQKIYEKEARGGARYIELLKTHFGVTSPDARLQRPEYLGGNRIPLTINQVLQQSATVDGSTPQGTTTGQSLTTDNHADLVKSFVEHGYIIGVAVARYHHTYQQGLERFWSRRGKFDYYWPALANIGEVGIKNKEIYATGTSADDEIFGYQEAWYDLRYKPSRVAGEMRSNYAQSLDVWHLADDYSSQPYLSASWLQEDKSNVDRVLAVSSNVSHQFLADFFVQNRTTRAIPLYSIPGLIDHH